MTPLRLIIETHPAWQDGARPHQTTEMDRAVPAPRQTLYTLLGRRGTLWHTVVPRIAHMADAVQALDTANRSQLFDRLVVAQAHGLAGQPLGNWETCLCAVPPRVLAIAAMWHDGASFADLLGRAGAHNTLRPDPHGALTAIRHDRRDASMWLLILLVVGLWSQAAPVLYGIALLCIGEALYQEGALDRLSVPPRLLQTGRFYFYSLYAGLIALPLLAGCILWLLDRLDF